jgi:hypothetical protein
MRVPRTPVCVLVLALGIGVTYAAPGDPVGTEFQVNTFTIGSQRVFGQPMAQVGTGFVVVWRSDGGSPGDASFSIEGKRFNGAGQPIGAEFQVNTHTTGDQGAPSVASIGSGKFVVVWRSYDTGADPMTDSVQAQRYAADGAPLGGQLQVNAYTTLGQDQPVVAPLGTAGGFVVAWRSLGSSGTDTDAGSIQAGLFDSTGARVSEFQVNTYTTGGQEHPSILALENGGFVVAWESLGSDGSDTDEQCVRLRRFDAAGTPQGSEFQGNTFTTSYQVYPGVGSDGSGGFIVTWSSGASGGTDTSNSSAQARRFDGTAAPLGDDFQVNSYTTGYQYGYAVAPDGAGGFVVVWAGDTGNGDDQSQRGIYARRFDAFGAPASDDFQVNTYTTNAQHTPRVAPDGAGGFVVVWNSTGSTGTDSDENSVQAQRFAGGPTTTSSSVTSTSVSGGGTTTTIQPIGEPLAGRKLQLATRAGHPEKSKLALVSSGGVTLGRGNASADDPVLHGGALTIASDAGGFSTALPLAGSWKYVGKSGQGKGYKWKSRSAPIRSVVVKNAKLAIKGRGAGLGFDLDDDPNPVRIELAIGGHAYCLEFGGTRKLKAGKVYRAKGAPAPAGCP